MNIAAQTAEALLRAAIIAGAAIAISGPLSRWLATQTTGRARKIAWALLLAPFFTPALLVSYAFSRIALALVASPWSHEALYVGVLTLKLIPVAAIVRALVPAPLPAEAWHAFRIMAPHSGERRVTFHLRGAGAGPWIAGGLVFLLAFSEFELASLWSIRSWTVALFDAQVGGLALAETFRLVASPLGVELALLAAIFRWTLGVPQGSGGDRTPADSERASSMARLWWIYLAASAALVSLLPLTIVATQAAPGLRTLAASFALRNEFGASLLFAASAAILAESCAQLGKKQRSAFLLAVPGLLGALVISLIFLALFQTAILRPAYDTPLPLVLALTIALLPLAVLLRSLRRRPSPARHVARQLGSRRLIWEMETRPRCVALGILFCCAWFDFTASSLLAPVGLTPVFVRLHNLAHYGQTAVLSAMMLTAFLAPVVALALTGSIARFLYRKETRPFHS